MSTTNRDAIDDDSRGGTTSPGGLRASPARLLALAMGLLGGCLLAVADLSALYAVNVLTVRKATVSGHAQHSYGLALVGLAAIALTLLVVPRGVRAAGPAIVALGLAALAIAAIAGDFHDVHSTGAIGTLYEDASARPLLGFYCETLGAALLVAGGLLLGVTPRRRPPTRARRSA